MPALDPTRTIGLRRRFLKAFAARFKRLEKAIEDLVVGEDAFGIQAAADRQKTVERLTGNTRFQFSTDAQKVKAFQDWLAQRVDLGILETESDGVDDEPWLSEYIGSAYKQGVTRAYVDAAGNKLLKAAEFVEGSKAQFLESTFGSAQTTESLKRLYSRSFESLKGVTAQMSSQMSRVLTDGLAHGKGPRDIARELRKEVGLSKVRADRIARTEIIYAYNEGQLDSFQKLGVEKVGILSEWLTAGDNRVCPKCAGNEGKTFTIEEARGMIPLHPNCRCAWVPHVPLNKNIQDLLDKGRRETNINLGKGKPTSAEKYAQGPQAPVEGLFNHQPTAVARWMGKEGWSFADAKRVLEERGATISDATLKIQLAAGKKGQRGDPAPLTDEQKQSLVASKTGGTGPKPPPPPLPPLPPIDPIKPPPPLPPVDPVKPPPPIITPPPPKPAGGEVTPEELASFKSHSSTALVRHLGKEGFTKAEAKAVLDKLGIEVKDSTLATQLNAGKKGERGDPAAVSERQKEILARFRAGGGTIVIPPPPKPVDPAPVVVPKPLPNPGEKIPPKPKPEKTGSKPTKAAGISYSGKVDLNDKYSTFGESVRQIVKDQKVNGEYRARELGKTIAGFVDARVSEYQQQADQARLPGGPEVPWRRMVYKEVKAIQDDYLSKMAKERNKGNEHIADILRKEGDPRMIELDHFNKSLGSDRVARAWINRKTLESIRDMGIAGGGEFKFTDNVAESQKTAMKVAARAMPRDWIKTNLMDGEAERKKFEKQIAAANSDALKDHLRAMQNKVDLSIEVQAVKRGWSIGKYRQIGLSGNSMDGMISTAVHELTHQAETDKAGALPKWQTEFYGRRTAGLRATEIYKGEKGIKDDFLHHYMGKKYGRRNYEVMTMGCEDVLVGGGGHTTSLHEGDRDMLHFVLGMLAGV